MLNFYRRFYAFSWDTLIQLVLGALLQSITVFGIVYAVNRVVNVDIPQGDTWGLFFSVGMIFLGTCLVTFTALRMQKLALGEVARCSRSFRLYLANQSVKLSKPFRDCHSPSKLHHIYVYDTLRIDEASLAFLVDFLPSLITAVAINCLLLFLNGFLYLLLVATVPLLILVSALMNKRLSGAVQRLHLTIEEMSEYFLHLFQTLDLVHIQSASEVERSAQEGRATDFAEDFRKTNWLKCVHLSSQNFIVTLSALMILVIGGLSVMQGTMTFGGLVSFYVGVGILKRYLMALTSSYEKIITGRESLKNLLRTLNEKEIESLPKRPVLSFNGHVRMNQVSFDFDKKKVLDRVSFELHPGTVTSISGPNGVGKTTLLHLILGFYEPTEGELFASGVSYKSIDLTHLRREIGVVTQTPLIRSGTILENITYGCSNTSIEEVERVAALASVDSFVDRLPKGYDTPVGAFGCQLSGGEKQKISLARALLGNPKLLILDEPTNHLDKAGIDRLFSEVLKQPHNPAILCITHHQELIHRATHSLSIMEGGTIG